MQVFTKNSARWRGRSLTDGDIQLYRSLQARTGVAPVIAHAAYLINLCALNPTTLKRSRRAFIDELQRCEALGIRALVFHPGSHLGKGEAGGIRRIVESLNMAHAQTPGFRTITALETTAGQGTALGYRFDHLRDIISHVEDPDRMGVCIDTCHLFAAGYDITTDEGWEATLTEFDRVIGFHLLVAIHVNDSRKPLGSRVDRHEHIGKGLIGLTAFRMLMNDSRLLRVPKILETEKSEDMHEDVENMALLRSLRIHREGE
jgi:deoxyribonuclease-4